MACLHRAHGRPFWPQAAHQAAQPADRGLRPQRRESAQPVGEPADRGLRAQGARLPSGARMPSLSESQLTAPRILPAHKAATFVQDNLSQRGQACAIQDLWHDAARRRPSMINLVRAHPSRLCPGRWQPGPARPAGTAWHPRPLCPSHCCLLTAINLVRATGCAEDQGPGALLQGLLQAAPAALQLTPDMPWAGLCSAVCLASGSSGPADASLLSTSGRHVRGAAWHAPCTGGPDCGRA